MCVGDFGIEAYLGWFPIIGHIHGVIQLIVTMNGIKKQMPGIQGWADSHALHVIHGGASETETLQGAAHVERLDPPGAAGLLGEIKVVLVNCWISAIVQCDVADWVKG